MKKYITAGLAVRRQIRRFLLREGVDFKEDKGWIESEFYLNCTDEKMKYIAECLENNLIR